jgi:Bardet-Biedl syndrome 7 protein
LFVFGWGVVGFFWQTLFQTPPGLPVRAVHLAGERIFVASGVEVAGYSKKGKRFYNITTLMTEPITQL